MLAEKQVAIQGEHNEMVHGMHLHLTFASEENPAVVELLRQLLTRACKEQVDPHFCSKRGGAASNA